MKFEDCFQIKFPFKKKEITLPMKMNSGTFFSYDKSALGSNVFEKVKRWSSIPLSMKKFKVSHFEPWKSKK